MYINKIIPVIFVILLFLADTYPAERVIYAGTRASSYGAYPRPTYKQWVNLFYNMADCFSGSKPAALWGIGRMGPKAAPGCIVEFASDGQIYENVTFEVMPDLNHEELLSYFDNYDIDIFLQVEPGQAEVLLLMNLILEKFGHHKCIAGFGVDVEWYKATSQQEPNELVPVTDSLAEVWEKKLLSYNSQYRLYLKHWEAKFMPKNYRGNILFINDSQGFNSISAMTNEFAQWAEVFEPNPVIYQIGYPRDKPLWGTLSNPPKELGNAIVNNISSGSQKLGIFWVDFTLKEDALQFLFNDIVTIRNPLNGSIANDLNTRISSTNNANSSGVIISYYLEPFYKSALLQIVRVNGEIIRLFPIENRKGTICWNSNSYAPGMYIINLQTGDNSIVLKTLLLP